MIKSIRTIEGLGGTGKTFSFLEECKELLYQGKPIVYLTFNKRIAEQTIRQIADSRVWVSTIHRLMYQELDRVSLLPKKPAGFDKSDCDKNEISAFFKKVEKTFLKHFADPRTKLSIVENGSTIFVDEFQNVVEPNLYECLKLIGQKLDIDYCFIGDRYQSIYDYLGHGRRNFFDIEKEFGRAIDSQKIKNKNYRSNPSVLRFINSFLEKNIPIEEKFLYKVDKKAPIEKQELRFFTNRKDEFESVKNECLLLHSRGKDKITILSRWNRNLQLFKDWVEKDKIDWLEVSTIHGYIGNEKDTVFIVGFEFPESLDERMVIYTGLIRAKEKLIITTSHPFFDPTKVADERFVEIINNQKQVSKVFKQLKIIKENKNLTRKKFDQCVIDSFAVTVRGMDAPFIPFIAHDKIHGRDTYVKSVIDNSGQVPIRIDYHKVYKNFTFILQDVNLLRRSGFNDLQVFQFLTNQVTEFYNYQVSLSDIKLTSIDLCRVVPNDDDLIELMLDGKIKCKNIRSHSRESLPLETVTMADIDSGTIYYNFTAKDNFRMAVYHPNDKDNGNRYFNKDVTKLELRLGLKAVGRKFAFGEELSVKALIDKIKADDGYLLKQFDRMIAYRK
ncbi:MAG: AAA family ATPase [Treponemataceae bacterium]